MKRWDHVHLLFEWRHNVGNKESKRLREQGWRVDNLYAERIVVAYYYIDPENQDLYNDFETLRDAISDLSRAGFEMVSYTEEYNKTWGHRRWYFKRQCGDGVVP